MGATSLLTVASSSPSPREGDVAVTRETILRLDGPLDASSTLSTAQLYAEFGGRRLLTRPEVSADRRTLILFHLEPLPSDAGITVTLDGAGLRDATGREIDPDGDGQPGGSFVLEFETASIAGLPGTGVEGRVFAAEKNPDGSNRPLANVIITVDGAEETLRALTDASGAFRLMPAPAGRFFVHVDGRTAAGSQWPGGAYYPFVGKAWEARAGRTNNLAGGTGEIYLPLIPGDTLQTVSPVSETRITFGASELAKNPALAGVEVNVPANALFNESGVRGGRVGIAAVPPDRLPEPLPPGLNLPIVITIQTDGPQNFDQPVPVRFPNLPDPVSGVKLGPGAKTVLWSFNHDTGRWEPQGTATVTVDGNFAITDPGVGVRQPGWHGLAPGSGVTRGPPRPPTPSECTGEDCPPCVQTIFCDVPTKEGKHYALCALDCLGDVVDDMFGDEKKPKPPRTAFETGLRCIGGPDTCPRKPEDSLTPERRDCMDRCRFPQSARRVFVLPCEGFLDPCERPSLHGASPAQAPGAFADLLPDRFEEQLRFWEVEGEFLRRLTGSPKITENSIADVPKVTDLFDAFAVRVRPGSPSGIHLSAAERAELVALPKPGHFSAAEWAAVIDRLDSLQGAPVPADVAAADAALEALVAELRKRGWRYRLDGLVHGHLRLSRARAPLHGSAEFPARSHYYLLHHHQSRFEQRGRLSPSGELPDLVLSPSGFYTIYYFDPVTGMSAAAFFQAGEAGRNTIIPTAPFEALPSDAPDTDGDQLADFSERIVGTSVNQADSDGDGLPDGAEIVSGTNPLDGAPQALGTLAGADTPGVATDVTAWNDTAAVADGAGGVTLFDVSHVFAPVRLAQFDTPGTALAVAGAGTTLAVADDVAGVAILDVASPSAPALRAQTRFTRPARAVAILEGSVVVGLGSGELVVLTDTGIERSRTPADNRMVQDVLALNGLLYVLKNATLQTFLFDGTTLTAVGSLDSPGTVGAGGRRWRLAGGGNRLYATHGRGFNVFDISAPNTPNLLRSLNTAQFGWKQIVPDGAGWGLAAVDANSTDDGAHDVSLYSLGADGTGTNVVSTLSTPGLAAAVCFHRGAALVADGTAGLSVVNVRGREVGPTAPAVRIATRLAAGSQTLEAGALFTVVAQASDNDRVSHVEFFLDEERVAVDGNHPFEAPLRSPALAPGQSRFTLRARAVDTAGNATWSDPLLIDPSSDQTGPRVIAVTPGGTDRFVPTSPLDVTVRFDEPVGIPPGPAGFELVDLGPDGVADTADDTRVATTVEARDTTTFALVLPGPLPVGAYQARIGNGIRDLAGNPMAATASVALAWGFTIQPLGEFIGTSSPFWGNQPATANNWSFARIPTIDDFVRIATPTGAGVRVAGQALAYDLLASTPMEFDPDTTLRIARRAVFDGPVTVGNNGSWRGAMVEFQGETRIRGALRLGDQDWVNFGHLVAEPGANLFVSNTADNPTGMRNAPGAVWEMQGAQLGYANQFYPALGFINEGLLVASGTGRNDLRPSLFTNLGDVQVRGGILDIASGNPNTGPARHLGNYEVLAGATLRITGQGDFGRASRITGAGTVDLAGNPITVRGTYETSGSNQVPGTVTFGGSVRTTGPWANRGGHAIFTGLSPRLAGPAFVSEGALTVSALPRLELDGLRLYRDLTVNTELQVNGPFRLDSPVTVSGVRLLGAGLIRALGPVTFTGIVNSTGAGLLEILGEARGEGSTIVQFNNSGYGLAIGPTGAFDVSGIERITVRGGITNGGSILKTDASATEVTRSLVNRGTVRLTGGTLVVQNGPFVQTSGSISLEGGQLTVRASSGVVANFSANLLGGTLEGAGILACRALTNSARITPGTASHPTGILTLEVGTHPTLSIVSQAPTGVLEIDVAGPTPGASHDQLKVSGRAVLGGTLALRPVAGFTPALGDEFTVLTCGSRVGTFAQVTGTALPGGRRFEVVYEPSAVKLRVVGGP
jgi:hypothetical protein